MNGNDNTAVRRFAPDLDERLAGILESIGPTHDSEERSRSLITRANTITSVTCADDQSAATAVAMDIRRWVKALEEARTVLTKPLDAIKARCIEVERSETAPLVAKQRQLERLVLDFQQKEARRVAEEEARRNAELARLEQERLAAEAKARQLAEKAKTEKQLDKAIEMEAKANALEAQFQAEARAPLPEIAKASGMAMRKVLRWEVTDIDALVKARPDLCKIEPKASAIQSSCVPERPVPGLKLWWEPVASTRTR